MITQLGPLGLSLNTTKIDDSIRPDPLAAFNNDVRGMYRLTGKIKRRIEGGFDVLHSSVKKRLKSNKKYRPDLQKKYKKQILAFKG